MFFFAIYYSYSDLDNLLNYLWGMTIINIVKKIPIVCIYNKISIDFTFKQAIKAIISTIVTSVCIK